MTWRAVDGAGRDLATGRPPVFPGRRTPVEALAAAPVASWPVTVVTGDGRTVGLARALGAGGQRVERLLGRVVSGAGGGGPCAVLAPAEPGLRATEPGLRDLRPWEGGGRLELLARATPAGPLDLPVVLADLAAAGQVAASVDGGWLARMEDVRHDARRRLVAAGREADLEAALHVAVLVVTASTQPHAGDREATPAEVVRSGGILWLLGGAVAWALASAGPEGALTADPFEPWAELLASGLWPVGPAGDRLVVGSKPGGGGTAPIRHLCAATAQEPPPR